MVTFLRFGVQVHNHLYPVTSACHSVPKTVKTVKILNRVITLTASLIPRLHDTASCQTGCTTG